MKNHTKKEQSINEMILINKDQKSFYEDEQGSLTLKGNRFTQLWRELRRNQIAFRQSVGINESVINLHTSWLHNLCDKSVLDLGCYSGNELSLHIAEKSLTYLGIDLSESAIAALNSKINSQSIQNAKGLAVDFLSEPFQKEHKGEFDIIYAHSVCHHFKYFESFLENCHNLLKEDGIIISLDPLQTYLPMYLVRRIYRPFQSDKQWEYPFTRKTFLVIKKYFSIEKIQGLMGKAKYAFPVYLLSNRLGVKIGRQWANKDILNATKEGRLLYSCLQVTMLLRKLKIGN